MAKALIFQPLPIIATAASTTAPGHSADYVGNDHMGVTWQSQAVANPTLSLDLGSDLPIDIALLMGCSGATSAWAMTVNAATTAQGPSFPGGSYSEGPMPFLAGTHMLPSGRGAALWLPDAPPPITRHLRFAIDQGGAAPVTIARVAAGQRLALARNFSFGAAFGIRDLGSVDFSRRGVLLRQRGARLRTVGLTFSSIHKDEVEAAILPMQNAVGNSDPIGIITDPAPDAMRQRRIYFGFLVGDLGAIWRVADGFEWRANLVSLI